MQHSRITLGGITGNPHDTECPDGDLDVSVNLVATGSGLELLSPPITLFEPFSAGMKVIGVHHNPDGMAYIVSMSQNIGTEEAPKTQSLLFWCRKEPDGKVVYKGMFEGMEDCDVEGGFDLCSPIGNLLCLGAGGRRFFARYRDGGYLFMGTMPRMPMLSFKLVVADKNRRTEDALTPTVLDYMTLGSIKAYNPATFTEFRRLAFHSIDRFTNDVAAEGKFCQPFFARYAVKLFDGSHAWVSPPVLLMAGNTPMVRREYIGPHMDTDGKPMADGSYFIRQSLEMTTCRLAYKCLEDCSAEWDKWEQIVETLDIYITPPMPTYDTGAEAVTGLIPEHQAYPNSWWPYAYQEPYPQDAQPPRLAGIWASSVSENPQPQFQTPAEDRFVWGLKHSDPRNALDELGIFYKIAEIPLKSLHQGWNVLEKDYDFVNSSKDLRLLTTMRRLDEETVPGTYSGDVTALYNSRFVIANPTFFPMESLPMAVVATPCSRQQNHEQDEDNVRVRVFSRKNSKTVVSEMRGTDCMQFPMLWRRRASGAVTPNLPLFLAHPDPDTYLMEVEYTARDIQSGEDTRCRLGVRLTPMQTTGCACWMNPRLETLTDTIDGKDHGDLLPENAVQSVSLGNRIMFSEAENPFVFRHSGYITAGAGRIMAVEASVRAVSSGQFGQYPLFAFSSDGIWAIGISDKGEPTEATAVSRAVLRDRNALCVTEQEIAAVTDSGILLVSGSHAECISDKLDRKGAPPISSDFLNRELVSRMPPDYRDSLLKGKLGYEPHKRRLFLVRDGSPDALVLDMESGNWGVQRFLDPPRHCVCSWPAAEWQTAGGKVVSLSEEPQASTRVNWEFLTRPVKLGSPGFKTIRDMCLRWQCEPLVDLSGTPHNEPVRLVLLGSSDNVRWQVVASSATSGGISGIGGSPYRYFRLAAKGVAPAPGTHLFALDVASIQKLESRLRR